MTPGAHAAAPARRWGRWVALAIALAVVAFIAAFAWDAAQLKESSVALRTHAAAAQEAIRARDAESLVSEVDAVQAAATEFAGATTGPHWWIASYVPWVKNQTVPLHQAGQSTLAITEGALGPLADLDDLGALQTPQFVDGRIDPYILEPYRETLAGAADVMAAEQAELASVNLDGTVSAVREPFLELVGNMATLGTTIQGAHVAAEVLPAMLGADGARTYLVMVQNNAEPRATGGIPGAVMEVSADDGKIDFLRYVSASTLGDAVHIPGPLTEDEERIFSDRMLRYPQDVNFTPEYSRSAELMVQYWERKYGAGVDGVLSIDPVALGYMLQGMPPTEIAGITVTADNLASVMLNESYLTFPDPADSDAFFALASQSLFGLLVSGSTQSIAGLEQATDEGRFMVWSGDSGEQELLATTPVAGRFLERGDTIGLFANDGSGSKIGYYIDTHTTVTDHMCPDGSLSGQTIVVTMTHTFDGDVADLPEYIAGGWLYPAGEYHANILLYPASGTGITAFRENGEVASLQPETHDGRRMSTARVVLKPGESVTLEYAIAANERGLLAPGFVQTPGPVQNTVERVIDAAGSGC